MALEATFRDLTTRLATLREELIDLRTTVLEDKPLHGEVVLIGVLSDALDDMLGAARESSDDGPKRHSWSPGRQSALRTRRGQAALGRP